MNKPTSPVNRGKHLRIITQILTPAIKLWLRTQLSQVSHLEVQIQSSDRQIFSGLIPLISIFASNVVYQDIHVTQIELTANNIQVNVGAILRGKPLRLLETVPVIGKLIIQEQELNHSLSSNLLSMAINDVLVKLLPEQYPKSQTIHWQRISLENQRIHLYGVETRGEESVLLEFATGLELVNGQELQLFQVKLLIDNQAIILENNFVYSIYLGSDVDLQEVELIPGSLVCSGRINVNP